jgi:hypothetical protein
VKTYIEELLTIFSGFHQLIFSFLTAYSLQQLFPQLTVHSNFLHSHSPTKQTLNIFKQSLSELSQTSGLVTRGGGDTNRWRGIETSRRKTKKLAYDVATCHVSSPASLVVRPIFCGSPMLQNVCGSLKHLPT